MRRLQGEIGSAWQAENPKPPQAVLDDRDRRIALAGETLRDPYEDPRLRIAIALAKAVRHGE
jgi:hypothetical protein